MSKPRIVGEVERMPSDKALVRLRCTHEVAECWPKHGVIKIYNPPPYATVADCGYCFKDVGEQT